MSLDLPTQSCLWQGPFSEHFEKIFLELVAREHEKNPFEPKYILVGSNLLGIHLKQALTRHLGHAFNVKTLTFLDLAKHILNVDHEADKKRSFPEGLEEWMLEKLLTNQIAEESRREEDLFLKNLVGKKGFVKMLQKHFQRLTEYQSTGQEALRELYELHRENYLNTYENSYDLVERATKVSKVFLSPILFCYGFYDLTTLQKKLLEKCSQEMTLFCFLPLSGYRHEMIENTAKFFKSICKVSQNIDGNASKKINIDSYGTLESEANSIATRIKKTHEREEVPYEDMAVILPSPHLAAVYRDVFEQNGITYFLSGGEPLLSNTLGQGFLAYLDLLSTDKWLRRDLIDVLSRWRLSPMYAGDMGEPADWDVWTQEAHMVGGFDDVMRRSQKKLQAPDPREVKFFQFLISVCQFSQELRKNQSHWSAYILLWQKWFETFLAQESVYEKIVASILTLSDLEASAMPPSFVNAVGMIKTRVSNIKLSKGLFKKKGIYLGTAAAVRSVRFKKIWLTSLSDDQHPKKIETHDWVKLDQVPVDDQSFLYHLLLLQGEEVNISYARQGFLHQELHPSPFVKEQSIYEKKAIEIHPWLPWQNQTPMPKSIRDFQSEEACRYVLRGDKTATDKLSNWSPLFSSVSAWVDKRLGTGFYTEYDGLIQPEATSVFQRRSFSPKSIGDFSTCPYQYFLRSILKISEAELPEDTVEVKKLHRGNIVHEILFSTFTELKQKQYFPVAKLAQEKLLDIVQRKTQDVLAAFEKESPLGLGPLWNLEKKWIFQDVWHFMLSDMADELYSPEAFEVRFGMQNLGGAEDQKYSTEKRVTFPISENSEVEFYGKIDRIDLSHDQKRIRVIDYKTGETLKAKEDSLNQGKSVQLPIYLLAAAGLFPAAHIEASEAWLMSTSLTGGFRKTSFSGLAWLAQKEAFAKLMSAMVELHSAGKFIPNPGQGLENCRYCEFKPICGTSIGRINDKKKNDIRLATYFSLKDIAE